VGCIVDKILSNFNNYMAQAW